METRGSIGVNADDIQRTIEERLRGSLAQVRDTTGTGDHFEAIVVSDAFAGKSMIEQHRLIYAALGAAMSGPIHALALRTFTPDEWDRVGAPKS